MVTLLLLPAGLAAATWLFLRYVPLRIAVLQALVATGAFLVILTEAVSICDGVNRPVLSVAWLLLTIGLSIAALRSRKTASFPHLGLVEWCGIASILTILAFTGYTALLSPPNSADAMAYHLPRVLFWIQNGNVSFFPTSYLNQIMLQPVAEYILLHLYVLSGGDHFSNLVQFTGFAGSIIGVSGIALSLGLSSRGQVVASLFCATLPNAVLQASGAKNDVVLAFWLVASVLFAIRWMQTRALSDLVFLSLATGLALGTKGTAYLFLPPFLAAAAMATGRVRSLGRNDYACAALSLAAGVLLINLPQYWRNYDLSGNILGFDSAHGDGAFRWRNEHLGWRATLSNAIRNLSEQAGARSERWNKGVYNAAISIHEKLGMDPQDPDTTWRWSQFIPPRNSNHEADANNRWHLLLMLAGLVWAVVRAIRYQERQWLWYFCAPLGGFVLFCFYLKWQPFLSRLQVPLFIISAPAVSAALMHLRPQLLQAAICLLLVSNCRLALTENWTRPLEGERNLRNSPRGLHYFDDMAQFDNRQSYLTALDKVAASSCRLVGIDNNVNPVAYPFQALLLEKHPETRFVHTGVTNVSLKYKPRYSGDPCAVLCIDCVDLPGKGKPYAYLGKPLVIGRFLLFLRQEPDKELSPL